MKNLPTFDEFLNESKTHPNHYSLTLKGKYKKSKPPKYDPRDFKDGDKIFHSDFDNVELTIIKHIDDRDWNNNKLKPNALYLGGIEVKTPKDSKFKGNEYSFYYDTETLRKNKEVGGSFYKIST